MFNVDVFCYVCRSYGTVKHREDITMYVKQAYLAEFGIHNGDE